MEAWTGLINWSMKLDQYVKLQKNLKVQNGITLHYSAAAQGSAV